MSPAATDSFYQERTLAEGLKDIGEKGQAEIQRLYRYLCAKHGDDTPSRLTRVRTRQAPSLVTRSEAFMLGLANPRFAIRMPIFTPSGTNMGFVQMRRMSRFLAEIGHSELIRAPHAQAGDSNPTMKSWQERLGRASCVADGLFVIPEPIRNGDWTFLSVPDPVKTAYGESIAEPCVPFMKHIELVGGGMCAQACCFMASLLLYNRVRAVHGIADITALASAQFKPGQKCEFLMSGLSTDGIALFYKNAKSGIAAFYQPAVINHVIARRPVAESTVKAQTAYRNFIDAVCAYIRSGFPTILAVDLGRLAGIGPQDEMGPDDIYGQNGLAEESSALKNRPPERRTHAILAIGYRQYNGDTELLCLDPATVPFIVIRGSQLHRLGCYAVPVTEDAASTPLKDISVPTGIAVLPDPVRLPLLSGKAGLDRCEGLRTLAPNKAKALIVDPMGGTAEDRFHLIRVKDLAGINESIAPATQTLLHDLSAKLAGSSEDCRWIWIHERLPGGIVIWDAQSTSYRCFAMWKKTVGDWQIEPALMPIIQPTAASPQRPKVPIAVPFEIGLISSFCSRQLDVAQPPWPDSVLCELYTFMRRDADWLLPGYKEGKSVREWLALKAGDSGYVRQVAQILIARLRSTRIKKVGAFCTFMPGLSMAGRVHEESKKALEFLSRLAVEMSQDREFGNIDCIVVAAGSVLECLSWGECRDIDPNAEGPDANREVTYAKCYDRVSSIMRLVKALIAVRRAVPAGPSLAIELEPGVLSSIATHDDLLELVRQLPRNGSSGGIGLNCDIAHWSLAGISPESVDPAVRGAVLHAHLSVVGKGHFVDRMPLDGDQEGTLSLLTWLDFLRKTAETNILMNTASLELELADSLTTVHRSVSRLRDLVQPMSSQVTSPS